MIRHPFKKRTFIHADDHFDNQEIIVDNPSGDSSRNHEFTDMPKTDQLTQSGWNFSPYTRKNNYNDVTLKIKGPVPRNRRFKGIINVNDYHEPR